MCHYERRADAALSGEAPELWSAFLANVSDDAAKALAKLVNDSDSDEAEAVYAELIEYARTLA